MSVRTVNKICEQAGCGITVATGQLADNMYVWEISLHDSVTNAQSLSQGMGIGNWVGAKITHIAKDGEVTHVI